MTTLNVIDLYAGAGGLSLGAARAGFKVVAAVENDPHAMNTHKNNFPSTRHLEKDASALSGNNLMQIAGLRKFQLDGLIGGPPCQGFSHIGHRSEGDGRNKLFIKFFSLVKEMRPKFFLAENVPGILDARYSPFLKSAFSLLPKDYEILPPFKVNASRYGAPTTRTRVFFIGYKKKYVAPLKLSDFTDSLDAETVYVKNALEGLPTTSDLANEGYGWEKVGKMKDSRYSRKIQGDVPPGIGNQDAMDRFIIKNETSGCVGTKHSPELVKRYRNLNPREMDRISKSVRLDNDWFCPTLRAGTGSDRGSYQAVRPIHPTESRVITPREAARLQGFPDWFVFHHTKWHSFRQIGNSVSPIVAEYLLSILKNKIRK